MPEPEFETQKEAKRLTEEEARRETDEMKQFLSLKGEEIPEREKYIEASVFSTVSKITKELDVVRILEAYKGNNLEWLNKIRQKLQNAMAQLDREIAYYKQEGRQEKQE